MKKVWHLLFKYPIEVLQTFIVNECTYRTKQKTKTTENVRSFSLYILQYKSHTHTENFQPNGIKKKEIEIIETDSDDPVSFILTHLHTRIPFSHRILYVKRNCC